VSQGVPAQLAAELDTARRERTPVRQISLRHPDMTVEGAYAVQQAWVDRMVADGRTVVGRKVGLTSRPMQDQLGISEPDFGALLDDMVFESGTDVPMDLFVGPRIEMELAFVLARPLKGPGVTIMDALAATSHIVPAIEILDSRVEMTDPATGHRRNLIDTVSDNAADAGIVMGPGVLAPQDFRPRQVSGLLYVNGVLLETGVSSAVLGHPALAVAWLANKLSEFGVGLEAGQVVLSGSFIRAVGVSRGDVVHADFGDLGAVTCRFV
jgi:2-oxo-hept-3-ene-1,7-dioate hydratase